MRILHLINSFLPVTENWVYSQLRFSDRCESTVLCQYRQNEAQFPWERVRVMYARVDAGARLRMLLSRALARYPRAVTASAIAAVRPDVVHGHFAFESWRHLRAVEHARLPLVTTFYGLDINKLPRKAVWRRRYRQLFSYGAAFIVEGPFMGRALQGLGCPAEKVHVIHIGVDTDRIRALKRTAHEGQVNVMFVGLSREKKGPADALAAFASAARQATSVHLHLVGGGKYRPVLEVMARSAGIADRCTFHGYLSVEAYLNLLSATDIVLAPSVTAADGDTEGGAPVTIIEAQVAGIPVVGTTHCDIPEIVDDGKTGLLCREHDVSALASGLLRLALDPALRQAMGNAGAARACERHDIRKQVEKIAGVYEGILADYGVEAA